MNEAQLQHDLAMLEELWRKRPSAYTRCTADYCQTQRRFLPLATLHPLQRFDIFLEWAEVRGLRWATKNTYWTAVLSMLTALGMEVTHHDKKNCNYLATMAQQEIPGKAPPLTVNIALQMWCEFTDVVSLIILVAFVLGQRVSDLVLVRWDRVVVEHDRGHCRIRITFVEGKVIRFVGPYSLYLDGNIGVGKLLRQYLIVARPTSWVGVPLLFPGNPLQFVGVRLARFGLESRSIRRGGLQHMAKQGMPTSMLLQYSKHTSTRMLFRYLDYHSESEAQSIITGTAHAFYTIPEAVVQKGDAARTDSNR